MISTTDLMQLRASHAHMRLALKKLLEFDMTNKGTAPGIIDHKAACYVYANGTCDCGFYVAVQLAYSALEQAREEQ